MLILCLFFFLFNILDTEFAYSLPIFLLIQYFRHRICLFCAYFSFYSIFWTQNMLILCLFFFLFNILDTEFAYSLPIFLLIQYFRHRICLFCAYFSFYSIFWTQNMLILCLFFILLHILDTENAYSVPILAFNIIFWTQNLLILCLFFILLNILDTEYAYSVPIFLFIQYFRHRICLFCAYFSSYSIF
jgi:hypothetical protein